jgi:CRISPR-associated protein Csx14
MTESTMIVTIGGQAQVVTFALDWLLGQGEQVREVVVFHLSPDRPDQRAEQALRQVAAEFEGNRYPVPAWTRTSFKSESLPCRLRLVPIRRGPDRLADIQDDADADATWQTIYHLLNALKAQGQPLHLCIAGGRRMMGLLALSAAMLLCGHQDRVWHMYTPPQFLEQARDGAIMHARPEDGVRLIQVPVVPWGAYFPALRDLAQAPAQIIAAQTAWLDEAERARRQAVMERLTDRQRQVLRWLAAGHVPQAVAEELHISLATVNSHKTAILAECRLAWNMPEDAWLNYHFLREKFGAEW